MNDLDRKMLQIKSLDSDASICFSEYTGKWYVSANIEEGGDGVLVGICKHRATPEAAVDAYFDHLRTVDIDHYLVTRPFDGENRRSWKWNGAAFQEVAAR